MCLCVWKYQFCMGFRKERNFLSINQIYFSTVWERLRLTGDQVTSDAVKPVMRGYSKYDNNFIVTTLVYISWCICSVPVLYLFCICSVSVLYLFFICSVQVPQDGPEGPHHVPKDEDNTDEKQQVQPTTPPESSFRKLAPSKNRYTLLRDEL